MPIRYATIEEIQNNFFSFLQRIGGFVNETVNNQGWAGALTAALSVHYKTFLNGLEDFVKKFFYTDQLEGDELDKLGLRLNLLRKQATESVGTVYFQGDINIDILAGTLLNSGNAEFITLQNGQILNTSISPSSINGSLNRAIIVTTDKHNLVTGMLINVSGAAEEVFNVTDAEVIVLDDNSFSYEIDSEDPVTQGISGLNINYNAALIAIQSITSGIESNIDSGYLNLSVITPGLRDIAYIKDSLTGGSDEETDEAYRARLDKKTWDNTPNYTVVGIQQYLLANYNTINRIKILKNYSDGYDIESITKYSDDKTPNDDFRIIKFVNRHQYSKPGAVFEELKGSNIFRMRTGKISEIIDQYRIAIFVGEIIDSKGNLLEDTTSENMKLMPYTEGYSTILYTKDGSGNDKYPNNFEVGKVKQDIGDNVIPFTSDYNDFEVKAPRQLLITFTFSNISPNTPLMKQAIIDNLLAYFNEPRFNDIGLMIKARDYNSYILSTQDSFGVLLNDFTLTVTAENEVITDIMPEMDQLPDVTAESIIFN